MIPGIVASAVHIAGGFTDPTDIAGLELWLDASDTATITESAGAVSQWDDKSANGYNVALATAGQQPTTGSTTLNSLNVLAFDGNDSLWGTGWTTIAQPLTVFHVARSRAPISSPKGRILCSGPAAGSFQIAQSDGSVGYRTAIVYAGGADFVKGPADAYSTDVWGVSSYVINGASTTVYVDGVAGTTGDPGSNGLQTGIVGVRFDGLGYLTGDIAEIIVYDSALSDTDRGNVEAYLAGKWNL